MARFTSGVRELQRLRGEMVGSTGPLPAEEV
jgi:hypothetical protein